MDWTFFMSSEQAARIAKLESDDITTILTIMGLSQKAEDVIRIAQQIRDGHAPEVPHEVLTSTPKPLQIVAHSFVRDKNQYNAIYGLSDERAAELATLLRADPDAASREIKNVVSAKLESKNSGRVVEVILPEKATQKSTLGATTVPDSDGGAKELAAEVAKRPAIYGQYEFKPELTGLAGQYQYGVHLGDDLFAIGQSKKVVIAAARLCRVRGRLDQAVKPHIWYWTSWSSGVRESEIPGDVWDGIQSAFAPIKPRKSKETNADNEKKRPFEMIAEDVD